MKSKQQYKEFSERFREVMRRAKLDKITREAAAAKLGVSAPAVSYYWHGERIPRPGTAKKMARKLKCDADWLCTGKAQDQPVATSIELLEQIMLAAQELKAQQQHRERRSRNDGDRRKNK